MTKMINIFFSNMLLIIIMKTVIMAITVVITIVTMTGIKAIILQIKRYILNTI